ncbi:MAG: alpha/beta hydrolase [Pseudomonadota bacterium]
MKRRLRLSLITLLALALVACASKPARNQIFLMPAPDVYEEGRLDPFIDNDPISRGSLPTILYATDRAPATQDDRFEYYSDTRGNMLRLGHARIALGRDESITWEEARRVSLLKNRTDNYPLKISTIQEYGALEGTISPFNREVERSPKPGDRFAAAINDELSHSRSNEVFIYVHGYKVEFENPILVASELWHFLGYDGAFIAYSWPSTSKTLAYFSDLEDAANSARRLRALVLHVARNTDAEKIHIVGYSAGTRVVTRMLADLGMYGYFMDADEVDAQVKLGNVILVGSDVDRDILGGYLFDGAIRIPDSLTIYQSTRDKALSLSKFAFGKNRSGQIVAQDVDEEGAAHLARVFDEEFANLQLIDVTEAEAGTSGNGHAYFRESPWVSSDVLMTLLYGLPPEDRGLVRTAETQVIWSFPEDYITRLRSALSAVNPAFAEVPD